MHTTQCSHFLKCPLFLQVKEAQTSAYSVVMYNEQIMDGKGFQVLSNFLKEPLRGNLSFSRFTFLIHRPKNRGEACYSLDWTIFQRSGRSIPVMENTPHLGMRYMLYQWDPAEMKAGDPVQQNSGSQLFFPLESLTLTLTS